MPIPKPPYTAQFRQQIVELVQAGRKPSALSREFGCHVSSIHNWVRQDLHILDVLRANAYLDH